MHKYLCKPNSDPEEAGRARGEIIFSYEYKWPSPGLFLSWGRFVALSRSIAAALRGYVSAKGRGMLFVVTACLDYFLRQEVAESFYFLPEGGPR